MIVYFRKAHGVSSPNLYEWRREGSETWYRIYRKDIHCTRATGLEQNIIDLAEKGETVLLEAFYLKVDVQALIIGNVLELKKVKK